jgi:hypothetical protein
VVFAQPIVGRESMKIGATRLELNLQFTPTQSGKLLVSGEFAFSLCTADRCLMEKRILATDIVVS